MIFFVNIFDIAKVAKLKLQVMRIIFLLRKVESAVKAVDLGQYTMNRAISIIIFALLAGVAISTNCRGKLYR